MDDLKQEWKELVSLAVFVRTKRGTYDTEEHALKLADRVLTLYDQLGDRPLEEHWEELFNRNVGTTPWTENAELLKALSNAVLCLLRAQRKHPISGARALRMEGEVRAILLKLEWDERLMRAMSASVAHGLDQ